MTAQTISRWARLFVTTGACFLVAWQVAALAGVGRRLQVVLGVYGFVLHVIFGKAYSLVPSYFERELAFPQAPAVQLPLTLLGTLGLAAGALGVGPTGAGDAGQVGVGDVGAALWLAGVAVFLAAIGWTVRDNPTGAATGTGSANADRRPVDRAANAFVPVALAYLAVGSYGTLAIGAGLPFPLDAYPPRTSHLLTAGFAALLLFAVGLRLLPRFLVAHPPRALVAVVLPAGALGPALIAAGMPTGRTFQAGAMLEAAAVLGFAAAYATLFIRSDRRRVGFYGALLGAAAGSLAVLLGLSFAFGPVPLDHATAHFRLNVLGLLGLSIVGVAYQFYPPNVGTFAGADDRTAFASLALLGGGLAIETAGLVAGLDPATTLGRALALAGALLFAYLVTGLFYDRHWRDYWRDR